MAAPQSALTEVRLTGHTREQEHTLTTMYPDDFSKQHAGSATDFSTMCSDFQKLCPDFGTRLDFNKKYYCVDYCGKVLYEIGPMSRRIKAGQADKYYDLILPNSKHALIATYKSGSQYEYKASNDYISLSVKQASLLAMTVLDITEVLPDDKMVLTPLAGAIFSEECMFDKSGPYTWRVTIGLHSLILKSSRQTTQAQSSNYSDGTPSPSKHTLTRSPRRKVRSKS